MRTRLLWLVGLAVSLSLACVNRDGPGSETVEGFAALAREELAQREYRASENGEGLQAPNRAHNLRTYFGSSGIRVHDRTADGSPELLRLSLAGVGPRGDARGAARRARSSATRTASRSAGPVSSSGT